MCSYHAENVEQFSSFVDQYAKYRPTVPTIIIDILTQLADIQRPRLVVDMGSGTGLSTRLWSSRAEKVIGIEPNDNMRRQAEQDLDGLPNLHYRKGLSNDTGLPDNCADIVTVSQALHWMEPFSTFQEVARILRPGGVFAAIDNDFPPLYHWQSEMLESQFLRQVHEAVITRGLEDRSTRWSKEAHLNRMEQSLQFRYTREIALQAIELGNVDRILGLLLTSQADIQLLFKHHVSEDEIGLAAFRAEMQRLLGDRVYTLYFTYRVRLGVK